MQALQSLAQSLLGALSGKAPRCSRFVVKKLIAADQAACDERVKLRDAASGSCAIQNC